MQRGVDLSEDALVRGGNVLIDPFIQTTAHRPATVEQALQQVGELAAVSAIRDLVALYSTAVDDRDLDLVVSMFSPTGSFTRQGSRVAGHAGLRAFYAQMMKRYRTTLHVVNSHVVQVRGDSAQGLVTGQAELSMEGTVLTAAYRYDDEYSRLNGRWVFASRVLKFMYVVPSAERAENFVEGKRIRWPGRDPAEGDFPESAPSWQRFEQAHHKNAD